MIDGDARRFTKLPVVASASAMLVFTAWIADYIVPLHFLVSNNDTAASIPPDTVSFYNSEADGNLAARVPFELRKRNCRRPPRYR